MRVNFKLHIKSIALTGITLLFTLVLSAQTVETFNGSTTWTCPAGVTSVTVECWGGGGSGGSGNTNGLGSGGGGGGAYSKTTTIAVIPGNGYTVNVGIGGASPGKPNSGIAGGDSWFINQSTILAKGGSGGTASSQGNPGSGGTGGLASAGIGTTKYSGGNGGNGNSNDQGGGGGSSAGTAAAGTNGATPAGGLAPSGGGNGGNGGTASNGSLGNAPGGGGGGEGDKKIGGAGANGRIKLTYTISNDKCPDNTSVAPSTAQNICATVQANQLTATITTSGSSGTPTLQYQWYYNISNSNTVSGATPISGATSQTYTPPSATQTATRWYFCVGYATDNNCSQTNADQSLASNAVEVTIHPPAPATPVANAGTNTDCNSFTANWSSATNATSYELDVATDAAFNNLVVPYNPLNVGNVTTYNVTSLSPGTTYYYRLRSVNACTTSTSSNSIQYDTKAGTPATPGAISGPASVSPSTSGLVYSIAPVPNATSYNWTVPVPTGWTINSGNGSTSINVTSGTSGQNGNISVTASSDCPPPSAASTLAVTVLASSCPTSTSIAPSAVQTHCQNDPATQLTATITTSGGSGTPTLQYQWYYNSTNSNTVSGATLVSGATSSTYTPPTSILGSRWYFCVGYATDNGCGQTNADQSLASNAVEVTVITTLSAGAITGPTTVTSGATGLTYSISPVAGATSYTWTVPGPSQAWTITAGQGTNSITVTSGAKSGDYVTVVVNNACGPGPASQLQVFIGASPDCPTSTSVTPNSPQTVCVGTGAAQLAAAISTSGGSGTPTLLYQWYYNTTSSNTVAGATLISGATSSTYTPLTTVSELGSRWYFCVGYATDNGCSQSNNTQSLASNAVEVTVIQTPATPGAISGTTPVSPSTAGLTYSITAVPTATSYTWTVPTGWTITGGQGSVSMTATSGTVGQNGNITVTATNTCGTSAAQTFPVTVVTTAQPPTITLGNNPEVCHSVTSTSASLPYSATTNSPDQYSIDYNTAANTAGFVDVVNASLPASPVTLTVPSNPGLVTYYGTLTVRNSTSTLSSVSYSISVHVITTPAILGSISGNTTVAEYLAYSYGITPVYSATSYTWATTLGWAINSGQGTSNIEFTTGSAGSGNISVTATNACGTSSPSTLGCNVVVADNHTNINCNGCHIFHNAPGVGLTTHLGNANLCQSCHVGGGAAYNSPLPNTVRAMPGTSGNSHSWGVLAVNATYETVAPSNTDMSSRLDGGNITCSTCHNQHNGSGIMPGHLRTNNSGDAMCKDCHIARDVGTFATDNTNHKGSHPVGVDYPVSGDFEATPTGSVATPNGKVECSSCHQTHFAATTDGYLLRQTGDNTLCTSCHTLGTHNSMNCLDCHIVHNTNKDNIYMIRNSIVTPNSGTKTVNFTSLTGNNSFADGNTTYDGICEVCHTSPTTTHFVNDGTGTDQNHTSQGAGIPGQNCTTCHPHSSNFAPSGGGCTSCHTTNAPTFNSAVHVKHKDKYACSTCHFGHGSGGVNESTHPSGTINIVFDPSGMATRNGQDSNTPSWSGSSTKTCATIYCHSNGITAHRGLAGSWDWGPGSISVVYASPIWNSGSFTSCSPCHPGKGNMTAPYTITPGVNNAQNADRPSDSHVVNAHLSNDDFTCSPTDWDAVQCFWCHNVGGSGTCAPNTQGTYGTSLHVDGETHFYPQTINNSTDPGTMAPGVTHAAADGHCGDKKSCW